MAGPERFVTFQIEGDQALLRRLDRLKPALVRRITRPAARKALSLISKTMKRNAPKLSGTLKKSIGVSMKTYGREGTVWGRAGVRPGYQKMARRGANRGRAVRIGLAKPRKYLHLVELGTKRSAGAGFMQRAWVGTNVKARQVFRDETRRQLDRQLARLGAPRSTGG